jgi:dynein light chain LC8-type
MSISDSTSKDEPKLLKPTQEKVFIVETDMEDDMQKFAYEQLKEFSNQHTTISNQEIAQKLKEAFEYQYYPTWVCIVGKNFGCKINAQKKHYLCFQIDNRTIILYKFH